MTVSAGGVTSAQFGYPLKSVGGSAGVYSVEGVLIPSTSKQNAGLNAPFHTGLSGAGLNAFAVDLARLPAHNCATATPPIQRLWWHNIDFNTYKGTADTLLLAPGEAMTWAFVAPASGSSSIDYDLGGQTKPAPAFVSVSTTPCDFDTTKVGRDGCFVSGYTASIYYTITAGASASPYQCKLQPGVTYYMNIRVQSALTSPNTDACLALGGGLCGGLLQIY